MRFTIASAALIVGASASYGYGEYQPPVNSTSKYEPVEPTETPSYPVEVPPVYVTKTTEKYETYCPGPTTITYGTQTYTVTEETTLTITDCPCTYVETTYPTETPVVPTEKPYVPAPPVYPTGTGVPVPPVYPTGTGAPVAPVPSAPAPGYEGAASQFTFGLGAVVAAVAAFL